MKNNEKAIMFKSYYVVWKRGWRAVANDTLKRLNRTM